MNRRSKQKAMPVPKSRPRTRAEPGTRMSVLLANPDYLLEGFAEKRCKYIGELGDIPTTRNLSDRAYLLHCLDNSRNLGKLPWHLTLQNEVTVTISAFNMKIIREDRTGTVLHRLPIHHIDCCCYVNDDDKHLLFVRAGEPSLTSCPVHVLEVGKRADAEEVCTILQQVFQLVYTEATVQHLNESITAGERGETGERGERGETGERGERDTITSLKRAAPSRTRDVMATESVGSPGRQSVGGDSEEVGRASAEELVQQYMERLHKLLDFKELREFASLLKQYRDNLSVCDFLHRLKDLYGTQRSFLIPGMRSFIPEEDRASFEAFLIENGQPIDQSEPSAATKPRPPTPPAREGRRRRKGRGQGHVMDVDKFLADIDSHAESMMDSSNF